MSDAKQVLVPDIGDFKDVPVIEVLVKPGDTVKAEDPLVTLESDKATMDVPAPFAGRVRTVEVQVGSKVAQGSLIVTLEPAAEEATPAPAPAKEPSAAAPAPAARGETREVTVPDIGDFKDVPVIEVLVKAGDTVKAEDPLITLESDKATMDVPAPVAGTVKEVRVKVGDKVSQGTAILVLEAGGEAPAPAPAKAAAPSAPATPASATPAERAAPAAAPPTSAPAIDEGAFRKAHASPGVRRFARELGVDLGVVKGSGPKGRILAEDVQAYVKQALSAPRAAAGGGLALGLPELPKVDFAKFGPVETQPLSRIKKISGPALHRNWVSIPHVTNHDDADITELEAFRVRLNKEHEKSGVKVTMLAFLVKACVAALKKFPEFNASLDGESIVLKKYYHIGVAADTPNGLVVPVVKDADRKGVIEIAREMSALAAKARAGKLAPSDMQGGTFSISSLGGIGGTYFTPIINAPEVAILGVCRAATRPVWDGKQFAPRLILPLSLSWDHRVVDGAGAARFNAYLADLLADMRRLVL
ncbi:MAG: dihydrolipoyllysine-residue acetyltransferase [Pseudomonadota bacterium]